MSAQELIAGRVPVSIAVGVPRALRVPLAVLGLALLSFLLPSAPTYDPWAWIVWGREITQLDLMTTDGPSWKPLPVLFTTAFAPFGELAPDLWLLVARAGAIAGVWVAWLLGRRLSGGSVLAGLFAAAAYGLAPWTVRHALLGNSEGLFAVLMLSAVLLHVEGRRRGAFAAGLGCALLRPEAWPFLGLYGLWRLLSGDRRERVLVAGGFASLPLLWLGPEWWGSGNPLRAADRAMQPTSSSPAFAENPALEILRDFAAMVPVTAWAGLAVLVLLARRVPSRRTLLALAAAAATWVALVAYMTSDGFAGNARYLIPPATLAVVLAGIGVGRALGALRLPGALLAVAALAAAVVPSLPTLDDELRLNRDQAVLLDALPGVVAAAGGADVLTSCGPVVAGAYQVPAVAWALGIHTSQVVLEPQRPSTIFRATNFPDHPARPSLQGLAGPVRTLAVAERWRVLQTCGQGA